MNDAPPRRNTSNAGFSMGLVGGMIVVIVFLILMLIDQGTNKGDVIGFLIQLLVGFFIGQAAAEKQHFRQEDDPAHLEGVAAAGMGAALITFIITWIFIIIRGIVRDALGVFIFTEPISLCFGIFLNGLLMIAIGSWAGKKVDKRYRTDVEY